MKRVRVSLGGSHVKDGLYICRLDENPDEVLEIPEWMLDPARGGSWAIGPIAVASMQALLDLRFLLKSVSSSDSVGDMIDGHSPLKENVHEKSTKSPAPAVPFRPAALTPAVGDVAASATNPGCPATGRNSEAVRPCSLSAPGRG